MNNKFLFSTRILDLCIEQLSKGTYNFLQGTSNLPKNFNFSTIGGKNYYAKIEKVFTYEKSKKNDFLSQSYPNTLIALVFDIPDNKNYLVFLLSYLNESKSIKNVMYYSSRNSPSVLYNSASNLNVVIYDYKNFDLKVISDSNLTNSLAPYIQYYNKLYVELSSKKESLPVEVNVDFLRTYFDIFDKIITDDDMIIIPVKGELKKIKSINLRIENFNQKTEILDFYQANVDLLSEEDRTFHLNSLKELGVLLPKYSSLALLDLSELDSKAKTKLRNIFIDSKISKCFMNESIEGNKVRLKRIIEGIEFCLTGRVANNQLVNIICNNEISNRLPELLGKNKFNISQNYIDYLSKEYPLIANNQEQLTAINKIIDMKESNIDLMLVQGPPGTGKTELILALAKELSKKNYKSTKI